jgi:hypothetical protein
MEFAGDVGPEGVGIVDGLFVKLLVLGEGLNVSSLAEFHGRFELAVFVQNGVDVGTLGIDGFVGHSFITHDENLDAEEM